MRNLKNFTFVNCICCGQKIELHHSKSEPDFNMDDYMRQYSSDRGYKPESQVWNNGIIDSLSAGYGSIFDGNVYYIGICDECVNINTHNGRLRFSSNYLGFGDVFTKEELSKFEEKRNRENNINSLLEESSDLKPVDKVKIVKEKWTDLITDDYNTYPSEGIEVLVSDGNNHDVAYFIMSGTYKWVKVSVKDDDISYFDNFIPIKWRYI